MTHSRSISLPATEFAAYDIHVPLIVFILPFWCIDQTPPQLRVTSAVPPRLSNQIQWSFTFQCIDLTPCATECSVHQVGSSPNFTACNREWSSSGFRNGDVLEFSLRGQDNAGNAAAPMNYRWTVGNWNHCCNLILS